MSVSDVSFGYVPGKTLYEHLDLGVDCDSRIAVIGPNGAGKSTFLKLLDGEIIATEGHISRHPKLQLARFTQHHVDMMDLDGNAVEHMRNILQGDVARLGHHAEISIEEARKFLGRFGLSGDLALQPVRTLSGGQKSRLAFAELAFRGPHILLMDEPTNHLDIETIEALAMALNSFEGGLILVSHDERLIEMVCDELWVVRPGPEPGVPGTVAVFEGTFEEYTEMVETEFEEAGLVAKVQRSLAQAM